MRNVCVHLCVHIYFQPLEKYVLTVSWCVEHAESRAENMPLPEVSWRTLKQEPKIDLSPPCSLFLSTICQPHSPGEKLRLTIAEWGNRGVGGEVFFFFCQAELLISFPEGRGTASFSLLTWQIPHQRGQAGHPRLPTTFLIEAEPDTRGHLRFSAPVLTVPL